MANEEKTVRLTLRRTVIRGGKAYGPGTVDVPEQFARSLQASGAKLASAEVQKDATSTPSADAGAPEKSERAAASGSASAAPSSESAPAHKKPATKAALKEFGDATALRGLAEQHGVKVQKDATKADLVDALHAAEISLE